MDRPSAFRHLLVHIGGSAASVTAAKYAVVLAKHTGAALSAIYVVDEETISELARARIFHAVEAREYLDDLEADGRRYLNDVQQLGRAKGLDISPILLTGRVHELVISKAQELRADAVIIEPVTEFSARRDAYGDARERILRWAKCTVIVPRDDTHIDNLYNAL